MSPYLAEWPQDLPQDPFGDDPPKYKPQDGTLRTQNDSGPAKLRRRFTARVEDLTVTMQITAKQRQILEDFCCLTLRETLSFAWKNFRNDVPSEYRFKAGWSSVQETWLGFDQADVEWYSVTIDLEMLP